MVSTLSLLDGGQSILSGPWIQTFELENKIIPMDKIYVLLAGDETTQLKIDIIIMSTHLGTVNAYMLLDLPQNHHLISNSFFMSHCPALAIC